MLNYALFNQVHAGKGARKRVRLSAGQQISHALSQSASSAIRLTDGKPIAYL